MDFHVSWAKGGFIVIIKRMSFACILITALSISSISFSEENFKSMNLNGKINNSWDIHMEIKPSVDKLSKLEGLNTFLSYKGVLCQYSGFYYYDKYQKKIRIDGFLYSNRFISLTEFDENNEENGAFYGFINDNQIIKGAWRNSIAEKKYPFYLHDSKSNPEAMDLNVLMDRVGTYLRNDNDSYNTAVFEIYLDVDDKLVFDVFSSVKGDMGMVDGIAYYSDKLRNEAVYINEADNYKMTFKFIGNQVEITANDVHKYCESNVTLVGIYNLKE
jgi:hypothetical protein